MNLMVQSRNPEDSGRTIKVNLSGTVQEATDVEGIVVPTNLVAQTAPWMPLLRRLQLIMGDRLLVTSVASSFSGEKRAGSSHPNGWAIDVTMPDRITKGVNPHFENDIYLMTYLASVIQGPVILAFESDHIHIELSSVMPGVYRYPTSRPMHYSNDKLKSPRVVQDEMLWKVTPTSVAYDPSLNALLVKQREATSIVLNPAIRAQMIALASKGRPVR